MAAISTSPACPRVDYGGQGGLGDVVLHPDFANNGFVYLSFARPATAARAAPRSAAAGSSSKAMPPRLEGFQVIWRQEPKFDGRGHYGHRIAFSPDGRFMFISSGERQEFTPAQDMQFERRQDPAPHRHRHASPPTIPSTTRAGVTAQIWSLGHRNPLGLAFDAATAGSGSTKWARAAATS